MAETDVVIVGVVGVSTVIGLMRGLVRELMSLVVWLTAFVASLALGAPVAALLDLGGAAGTAIGFAIVFVVVLVAGALVQRMLAKVVQTAGIGGVDRMLGSMFGALRGALLTVVALIAIRPFAQASEWWLESALVPALLAFEQEVLELLGLAVSLFSRLLGSGP